MTRKKILSSIKDIITDTDVIFCIGKYICDEAPYLNDGTIYAKDDVIDMLSVALGVALATDKRVFVIAEDAYLLRYFGSMLQAAVSKCINLFFIILITESYEVNIKQTTIIRSLRSIKGILFNTGMIVHDYDAYFGNKSTIQSLKNIILSTVGPAIGTVSVSSSKLYSNDDTNKEFNFLKFISFIRNRELKTAIIKAQTKMFNLDDIIKAN